MGISTKKQKNITKTWALDPAATQSKKEASSTYGTPRRRDSVEQSEHFVLRPVWSDW